MAYKLAKGDECMLSGDYKSEGKLAFNRGDIVQIEDISPDRLQPGNKYLVHSSLLSAPVRLPGMVLKRVSCPVCKERLAPVGPDRFADSCDCGWGDVESAHAKSVQRLSDFHDNLSRQRLRRSARTEGDSYADADDTPFEFGHGHPFATSEPQRGDSPPTETARYGCPNCGIAIIVATECPSCGWQYVSAAADTGKKAARATRDIVIEGAVAFRARDWVVVEGESPDPQRPEYKYVVLSIALKKKFLLSDKDLQL